MKRRLCGRGGLHLCLLLFLTSCVHTAGAQSEFNVLLTINTESAEKALELYRGLGGHPEEIARLPGSRIALATTGLLSRRPLTIANLETGLEAAKFNQALGDDVFRIKEARDNAGAIQELLTEIGRRNFGQKVVSTVEQLFPSGTRVTVTIPVYFVAFGYQTIDAFVRRIEWIGDTPTFVDEGHGQLTIVVNLAKAVSYGQNVDERFLGMMSVVAHEVFHAAFGAYKDSSPQWRDYRASHRTYFDELLDLSQNEGIAYYLTLVQRSRGRLASDWVQNIHASFARFNANAAALLSGSLSDSRANGIIQESNTSGYWNNFGSITGMVIARQIDQTLGRSALTSTIEQGPAAFFRTYIDLMRRDPSLPQLSDAVVNALAGR